MNSEIFFVPHLVSVLTAQATVAWIYLGLLGCLTVRVWLSARLLTLNNDRRGVFLGKTIALSESVGDIAILLGVLGTLIGVTMAVAGNTGNVDPTDFMATFSSAFGVAISTTIAGGLTFIACRVLNSFDGYITGDQ
ncbi:MAG: hypothetical protein AB2796_05270 [Candidatus Thiodiazotropha sp.]